jgi:predicted HTH transcriptional regulator/tetratricopeptide (TPR) repeat protein
MNLSPQTLLDGLEGKLSGDLLSRLIVELRALPPEVVLEVVERADISLTGDGNICGNNNTIHIDKSQATNELVRVLCDAYERKSAANVKPKYERESQGKSDDSESSGISWVGRDSNLLHWYFEQCAKYDGLFSNHNEWGDREIGEHLICSGLASKNEDGHLYLTNAGVLLCCRRNQILRDVFHVHVKFTQRLGGNDLTEEFFGSVLYLYKELYERLAPLFKRRIGSPDFRDDAGGEKVFFEYPETAIVEALVNFLIHRDYSLDDLGFITINPDNVEFMNPGKSIFPIDELLNATSPLRPRYQRNPRLIEAMNKARLNQREGGGILRIRKELENNRSYLPDGSLGLTLKNDEVNNRFSLTIYKRNYLEDTASSNYPKQDKATVKTSSASIKTSSLIPRPPIIGFIIRKDAEGGDIVERLHEQLAPGKNQLVTLSGPGGVGKTTLAAEAARTLEKTYHGRFVWCDVNTRASFTLSTLLDDIATQLGQAELRTLKPEDKESQIRDLVAEPPVLIVLDNYETISPDQQRAIETWFEYTNCSALFTSRQRINKTLNITISAMTPNEAREFLNRLVRQTQDAEIFSEDVCQRIYETAEANPFVMEWVVAQIDTQQEPDEVLEELKHGEGDAAERVFDRSFNLLQLGNDGRDTLLALSLFTPSATREALAAVAGFGDDLKRINEALTRLRVLSLIKGVEQNRRFAIEGITRSLAEARLSKDKRFNEFRERFITYFLNYSKQHVQPTPEDFDILEAEKGNILAAIDSAFIVHSWDTVQELTTILTKPFSGMLSVRGYWDEALRYTEQAMAAAQVVGNKLSVAQFASNTAALRIERGEYDGARFAYQKALNVFREQGSEANISIALQQLGKIAFKQGNLKEAQELYEESLRIAQTIDHQPGIASCLHELGTLASDIGDFTKARQFYEESLSIAKRLSNPRSIALDLHQLGKISEEQGNLTESLRLYNESLKIAKKLGDQHNIALTLCSIATIEERKSNLEEAQKLYREALKIFELLRSPNAEIVKRQLEKIKKEG